MNSKHSSDERLLALLDGELTVLSAVRMRAHLHSCWECRTRLARMDAAARALAEARSKSRFLPRDRVEVARDRFLAQAWKENVKTESRVAFRVLVGARAFVLGRRGIAFACAAMLSVAAMVTVWQRRETEPVRTADRAAVRRAPVQRTAAKLPESAPPLVAPRPSEGAQFVSAAPAITLEHETAVLWLLHETGACRGQDIRVDREQETLYVRGVVDTAERRDDLVVRLRRLDLAVHTELRAVAEAVAESGLTEPLPAPERVTRVEAKGESLIREWLQGQKLNTTQSINARVAEIANASVQSADLAWVEGWALHDLRRRFGPVWHQLPESSRMTVLSMMRDHWSELQTLAARQRQLLGGVLVTAPAAKLDVLQSVQRWNEAIQQLFAPAEPVTAPTTALVAEISASLARVESMGGDDLALTAFLQSPPSHEPQPSLSLR